MPIMNGIEATKRIKSAHVVPVVIGLSINTCTEVMERMKEAGADACLSKEDESQHLYHVMKQLVDVRFPLRVRAPTWPSEYAE
jgi:CheY-like chemotaxis protein